MSAKFKINCEVFILHCYPKGGGQDLEDKNLKRKAKQ